MRLYCGGAPRILSSRCRNLAAGKTASSGGGDQAVSQGKNNRAAGSAGCDAAPAARDPRECIGYADSCGSRPWRGPEANGPRHRSGVHSKGEAVSRTRRLIRPVSQLSNTGPEARSSELMKSERQIAIEKS